MPISTLFRRCMRSCEPMPTRHERLAVVLVAFVASAPVVVPLSLMGFVGLASAQDRLQRSIAGPVTQEAVTRSLAVVPDNAGGPGGPSEVSLLLRIEFGFDTAELTGRAMRDLDEVAAALNDPQLAPAQVTLEGHTDATGPEGYNLRLSQRRAEAVVAYLVRREVASARLRVAGFGEYRLLPAFAPTDDRQRRVEIVRTF